MEQDLEKTSPSLGREAVYHEQTRISRLPSYLTVNMVRFYWRREIGKKTKIMRKVKFPFELDATELVTDDLRKKIVPVGEKLKECDKDRRERAKARRKMKKATDASAAAAPAQDPSADPPEEMAVDAPASAAGEAAGELPDEETKRHEELATLLSLVHPDVEADKGANVSGLYELAGIVSHKGASADGGASPPSLPLVLVSAALTPSPSPSRPPAGHYVGWCAAPPPSSDGAALDFDYDKQEWYKFDDEKVSLVGRDKILALEGGGEDHSAYILLYRSKPLA